jgi:Pyridine nucleotide-disulphide oxidoreductase, dimerisation domain
LPTSAVLRTHTIDETQGFMKALVAARDDRILGFTMIGAEAAEVVAVVQTAILSGLPYTPLRDAILTHPTMAEGLSCKERRSTACTCTPSQPANVMPVRTTRTSSFGARLFQPSMALM